jgi:hypothetical protein
MALCEQCGSINIALAKQRPVEKLLVLFGSRRPFLCRRCGWRARRRWTDQDLINLGNYAAGGAEPDPALALLDRGHVVPKEREYRRKRSLAPGGTCSEGVSGEFDLGKLDLTNGASGQNEVSDSPVTARPPSRNRHHPSRRRKKSRRRGMVATIALTAFVMFLLVIVGLVAGRRF